MPRDCGSRGDARGRRARAESRWDFLVEWPRRPRALRLRPGKYSPTDGPKAYLWDLPRSPTDWPRARRKNVQTQLWAPRRQSSGEAAEDRQDRDYRAQS